MEKKLGIKFLQASLMYFAISVTMGTIMTISPVYKFIVLSGLFERAHAHISLIGWVSLAIIGFTYYVILGNLAKPMYSERLGNTGFWLLNIGIFIEFISLLAGGFNQAYLFTTEDPAAHTSTIPYTMFILIFACVMLIGVYITIYNIYRTLKS